MSYVSHRKSGMTRVEQAGKQKLQNLKPKFYSFQATDIFESQKLIMQCLRGKPTVTSFFPQSATSTS